MHDSIRTQDEIHVANPEGLVPSLAQEQCADSATLRARRTVERVGPRGARAERFHVLEGVLYSLAIMIPGTVHIALEVKHRDGPQN